MSHLIIGDAIPTNDSASRVVWASVKERDLGHNVRYFLLVSKCMTHQSALSAKSAAGRPLALFFCFKDGSDYYGFFHLEKQR